MAKFILSAFADEGFALQVLLLAGSFADEEDIRRRVADAENKVRPRCAERTVLAFFALRSKLLHGIRHGCHRLSGSIIACFFPFAHDFFETLLKSAQN